MKQSSYSPWKIVSNSIISAKNSLWNLVMGGTISSTKKGDQFILTTDASPYREGVWDTTASGDLYTLLGSQVMKYASHNVALDTATGNFLGRDETESCQLSAWTESGVLKTYSAVSATAGTAPTWILRDSFDIMTGNRFIYGHVAFGETATILSNVMLNISGSVSGANAAGLKFALNMATSGALQSQSAFNMAVQVNTGSVLPQISGIVSTITNNSTQSWGAAPGGTSPSVYQGAFGSTATGLGLGNWCSIYQAKAGTFSGGKPTVLIGHESQNMSASETITSYGFYSFANTYGMWLVKDSISGLVLDGDGIGADLVLGNFQNSNLYYDGANTIFNPKLVGTGQFHIYGNEAIADTTSLSATELVTNGTFTGSATGWTLGTSWSYATNKVSRASNATLGTLTQTITGLTIGKVYYGSIGFTLTAQYATLTIDSVSLRMDTTKTYTFSFVATATSHVLTITPPISSAVFDIDDITIKEITDGILSVAGRSYLNGGANIDGGSTTRSALSFASATALKTSPVAGDMEYYLGHLYITNGARHAITTSTGVKTTSTTVSNTTTETTIYSYTFAAGELHADEHIFSRISGIVSSKSGSSDYTLRVKLGGTTLHTITRTGANVTNVGWRVIFDGTIRTDGASGTFIDNIEWVEDTQTNILGDTATHSIDTTIARVFEITVQWTTADPINTITCNQGFLNFNH